VIEFKKTWGEIYESLERVQRRCECIIAQLSKFEHHTRTFPISQLTQRLDTLTQWILSRADYIHQIYGNLVHVFVMITEDQGLLVLWINDIDLLRDISYINILSLREALDLIKRMESEVKSGNWAEVSDWLKKYGKAPGLDFSKSK